MAQLVEHILGKDEVPGSNPGISLKTSPIVRKYDRGFSFSRSGLVGERDAVLWSFYTKLQKTCIFFGEIPLFPLHFWERCGTIFLLYEQIFIDYGWIYP